MNVALQPPIKNRPPLSQAPSGFFMTLRDIAFWIRSARTDAAFGRLRKQLGAAEAFDVLYQSHRDPYAAALPQFRYQRLKYERMISMLPPRHFGDVLDIGCGIGVFARYLSPFGDRILGLDLSEQAIIEARARSMGHENLEFVQGDILSFDGDGRHFDLIVLADTLYYLAPLDDARLKQIAARAHQMLAPGGLLLLVNHFFFSIDPASRTTRHIHNSFRWVPGLEQVAEYRRAFFLATIFEKIEDRSTTGSLEKPVGPGALA